MARRDDGTRGNFWPLQLHLPTAVGASYFFSHVSHRAFKPNTPKIHFVREIGALLRSAIADPFFSPPGISTRATIFLYARSFIAKFEIREK